MKNQPRNCATCRHVGAIHMSASESGHDEIICTTCEDEPCVAWVRTAGRGEGEIGPLRSMLTAIDWVLRVHSLLPGSPRVTWGVDACPECGRGGEVGKL